MVDIRHIIRSQKRKAMTGLAFLLFAIGWIGVFLPGLPTTIFWIGAVVMAGKACPVIEKWVYSQPHVGPIVQQLIDQREMSKNNKFKALFGMSVAVIASMTIVALNGWWIVALAVFSSGMAGVASIVYGINTAEPQT